MKTYRVYLQSRSGFYEQYSGSVKVLADNEDQAVEKALLKLKKGAFSDRDNSMWKIEKVERLYGN